MKPIGDRSLLEPIKESTTESGIILSSSSENKAKVICGEYAGETVYYRNGLEIDGYILVENKDLLAVI